MPKGKTTDQVLGLDIMSPKAREALLKVGREFGSGSTLGQADKTLSAIGTYGVVVEDAGFGEEDATKLRTAREGLLAAGVERTTKQTTNKTTNDAYLAAVADGKKKRGRGRTILGSAAHLLEELGTDEALAAEHEVNAVLAKTGGSGDDATKIAEQLEALRDLLSNALVAKLMLKRGGPKAVKDLAASAKKLRAIAPNGVTRHGTPAETERLDLLDGIIVRLCRTARKAARQVAKETGEEAIATAFELTELYPAKLKKPNGGGGGGGNGGGGGGGGGGAGGNGGG
jgi:hypothetical protein